MNQMPQILLSAILGGFYLSYSLFVVHRRKHGKLRARIEQRHGRYINLIR